MTAAATKKRTTIRRLLGKEGGILLICRTKFYIFRYEPKLADRRMRVFKSKWFAKFAGKERISDGKLCEAVANAEQSMIDADYGGGVIKQRIARASEGKSGGYRSIILFHKGDRAFFVYGFAKNERNNIDENDERDFKELAKALLAVADFDLENLVAGGRFVEVKCDDQG